MKNKTIVNTRLTFIARTILNKNKIDTLFTPILSLVIPPLLSYESNGGLSGNTFDISRCIYVG